MYLLEHLHKPLEEVLPKHAETCLNSSSINVQMGLRSWQQAQQQQTERRDAHVHDCLYKTMIGSTLRIAELFNLSRMQLLLPTYTAAPGPHHVQYAPCDNLHLSI